MPKLKDFFEVGELYQVKSSHWIPTIISDNNGVPSDVWLPRGTCVMCMDIDTEKTITLLVKHHKTGHALEAMWITPNEHLFFTKVTKPEDLQVEDE